MRRIILFVSLLVLPTLAARAGAQASAGVRLAPGSSIEVHGTSNVHDWSMKSSQLQARIEVPDAPARELGAAVRSVVLELPVTSLQSGKSGMDRNAHKALDATRHPTIRFRLTSYRATPRREGYDAIVAGHLTVNGVERPVEISATATPDGNGGVRVVGSARLRQTDFGVKPVTAMMGTIRSGDQVDVRFDVRGQAAQLIAELPSGR